MMRKKRTRYDYAENYKNAYKHLNMAPIAGNKEYGLFYENPYSYPPKYY